MHSKWNPGELGYFMLQSDDSGMGPDGGKAVCSLGDKTFFS